MELYEEFILSKKLKRRILELCGFNKLNREERLNRANEILNNSDLKQAICHQILGTTFRDIDKVMQFIIDERQLTASQQEEIELRNSHPEKYEQAFDPEIEFKLNKVAADSKNSSGYRTPSREEVAELVAASKKEYDQPLAMERILYPIFTRERLEALLALENEDGNE